MSRHVSHPSVNANGHLSPSESTLPPYIARSSYPPFLPFHQTVKLQLISAAKGLWDASRWDTVIRVIARDAEVRSLTFKSILLNTMSLASVYFFDLILVPMSNDRQSWLYRYVGRAYQIFWLLPVVGASFFNNSLWCHRLAKRTIILRYGPRSIVSTSPTTYGTLLNLAATSLYRVVMVFTYLGVSFTLRLVPVIGEGASFVFFCWIDAYYCYEDLLTARGLSLSNRFRYLEERWAYYLAFGVPVTALCMWGSSLANAALFALVYPAYIIMAVHGRPSPADPYNPIGGDKLRYPSPYIPIRIPVFAPSTFLNDTIIKIIDIAGRVVVHLTGDKTAPGGISAMKGIRSGHRRTSSGGVKSVEEGEGRENIEMNSLRPGSNVASKPRPTSQPKTRVKVSGIRRNLD